MGIPNYFSYIIKNHKQIIKPFDTKGVDVFFLDSNSIIYDQLRELMLTDIECIDRKSIDIFEKTLINMVYIKIKEYIKIVSAKDSVFIAFDGVAPVAKMEQQRNRRYKSYLLTHIKEKTTGVVVNGWDKCAITPGTNFMEKLGNTLVKRFKRSTKVCVSTSNEPGEGEHKMFNYLRNSNMNDKRVVVYGLDADLIMLCLNHTPYCKDIYLYRETPEFIKSIDADLEPNTAYVLDILELGNHIADEMTGNSTEINKSDLMREYIFLCFFLGNDFLPHFPAINIRTDGIHLLMSAYSNVIAPKRRLTDGNKIKWSNVFILLDWLAKMELNLLKNEYKVKDKLERRRHRVQDEDAMRKLDNIPTKMREDEEYINPFNPGWEERYYKVLFNVDMSPHFIRSICINYMEGLEWVMKYYTTGCCDWSWKYKYNYPPLLKDLIKYIPSWDTIMIKKNDNLPVPPVVQLAYVLPRTSLKLLPNEYRKKLECDFLDMYPLDERIVWAFCRYFWEAHVDLPEIDIEELKALNYYY
tara:strand:- start:19432 stop:21006 length:1575 start_codon:yes stop_codon:yes gene_type:complete